MPAGITDAERPPATQPPTSQSILAIGTLRL